MRRLTFPLAVVLTSLSIVGCSDELTSPLDGPSRLISDGANGGISDDVFFLPPLVPDPSRFIDAGEFNPNLTSAIIRVCRFEYGKCQAEVAAFGPGRPNGPIRISTTEEHYLAVWHTDESSPALVPGAPYRIEVFADADMDKPPVAFADVAIASTGRELKNLANEHTVALLDGRTLPIKVRFENGVRCTRENCIARRVDNTGSTLILPSGDGALVLRPGSLPPGVEEVTVTLQREPVDATNECVGKAAYTGRGLIAQVEACLHITTDPVLTPGPQTGLQQPADVFLCREVLPDDYPFLEFLQVIKADDERPLQALHDVEHATIRDQGFNEVCSVPPPETPSLLMAPGRALRFAGKGMSAVGGFLARTFGPTPAYAIDLGQGGQIRIGDGFSYFTFGVLGNLTQSGLVPLEATAGSAIPLAAQVLGKTHHAEGEEHVVKGVPTVSVVFTVTAGDGTVLEPEGEVVITAATPLGIVTGSNGIAAASLVVAPGTNTVTAVAMVNGKEVSETVTFDVTGLVEDDPPLEFAAIAAGGAFSCGLTDAGAAYCWGSNGPLDEPEYSLGLQDAPEACYSFDCATSPMRVAEPLAEEEVTFVEIVAGAAHACGLTADFAAYCWGRNNAGQLGDGTTNDSFRPVRVQGTALFHQLAAGGLFAGHTCGVDVTARLFCWGSNELGQLGDGTTTNRSTPTAVAAPEGGGFVDVSAGSHHTCGVDTARDLWCWGHNGAGQLGNGSSSGSSAPELVSPPTGHETMAWSSVSASDSHTCAISIPSAGVYCWGRNDLGQLGTADQTSSGIPRAVSGPDTEFGQIVTTGFSSCAVTRAGTAYCWGRNTLGVLGIGSLQTGTSCQLGEDQVPCSLVPLSVEGGLSFQFIAAGGDHVCALSSEGNDVYCWGRNSTGQLGTGEKEDAASKAAPTKVLRQ